MSKLILSSVDVLASCAVSFRYGAGPVLGYVRAGVRGGVRVYLVADTNVSASPRNAGAWRVIGPVSSFPSIGHAVGSLGMAPAPDAPTVQAASVADEDASRIAKDAGWHYCPKSDAWTHDATEDYASSPQEALEMIPLPTQQAQADASTFVTLADVVAPIVERLTMAQPVQQAQAQDTRAASPILQRIAEAQAALDAETAAMGERGEGRFSFRPKWNRLFDERERLNSLAVKADPVAYVRAYPSHAFAYRHLLPLDMVARIEAAETDEAMREAVREPGQRLPSGYSVESDMDGDWLLVPPASVTIVSVPGEPYLLPSENETDAIRDSLELLRVWSLAETVEMVPQPVQQAQARDRRRPPAFLVRREERKAARRVHTPKAPTRAAVAPVQRRWAAPVIRERITRP